MTDKRRFSDFEINILLHFGAFSPLPTSALEDEIPNAAQLDEQFIYH
jgi:hypothetical protein